MDTVGTTHGNKSDDGLRPWLRPPTAKPLDAPLPLHRFLPRFIRNPLNTILIRSYEEPYVILRSRAATTVYVSDPELVERVLLTEAEVFQKSGLEKRVLGPALGDGILTSSGPTWRWQRRTAAPLFRPAEIAALVPMMSAEGRAQIERWRAWPPGSVHDMERDMTETTFRVISATMFGGAADAEATVIQESGATSLGWVSWEIGFALARLPSWVWHPGKRPRARAARDMRQAVHAILARRRAAGLAGDDLMARLAAAKDPENGAPMSDEQIVDNMLTFLAAGHETTAKALAWTLYLVARDDRWQTRIRDEVAAVAGSSPITAEHLERMPITRQVVKEGMRLYPPAPVMSRVASKAMKLGDTWVEPGTNFVIPIYAIHRHRKLWDNPELFDPERFAPEREKAYHRAQFMPFGFGPRLCIGMLFAMLEAQALLGEFVRKARFDWDGAHVPEPVSRVTLKPKGGMPLKITLID
ncbi:MAG: cytochrome P450 [Gammaproteobacteria bacterium]|nr:cytochrome P450 [Gammaproteobacteria bacterium]